VDGVQNTIPDTEGPLFDCSQITYDKTVLLPNQLLSEQVRETVKTIPEHGPFLEYQKTVKITK